MDDSLDKSLINFVKGLSLDEQRANPQSKFDTIALTVETIPNDGIIRLDDSRDKIVNACFFISVAQAVDDDPYDVIADSEYDDVNLVVDSDISSHRDAIKKVAEKYGINILVHSGQQMKKGFWKINPEAMNSISGAKQESIIRLVTNNYHFEFIKKEEYSKFIYVPKTMNKDIAEKLQRSSLSLPTNKERNVIITPIPKMPKIRKMLPSVNTKPIEEEKITLIKKDIPVYQQSIVTIQKQEKIITKPEVKTQQQRKYAPLVVPRWKQ